MDREKQSQFKANQSQNKANSKPIAERVKLMQYVYLQRIMKKNAAKGYEKTKPIQTQFKPKQSQFQKQKTEVRRQMTDDGEDSKIRFNKGL